MQKLSVTIRQIQGFQHWSKLVYWKPIVESILLEAIVTHNCGTFQMITECIFWSHYYCSQVTVRQFALLSFKITEILLTESSAGAQLLFTYYIRRKRWKERKQPSQMNHEHLVKKFGKLKKKSLHFQILFQWRHTLKHTQNYLLVDRSKFS